MSIPCYVITLNPQSERVQTLLAHLAAAGVPAQVFQGVDGRQGIPATRGQEVLATRQMIWRHKCTMTGSEVGAYLSHYRVVEEAFASGRDRICVFEDDVELEPGFAAAFHELVTLPDEFEMIRLMGLKIRKRKVIKRLNDGVHVVTRPERGELGGQGYIINRPGMEKFLKHARHVFEPIDKVFDHAYEYDLRLFGVEPHLILETVHPSNIAKSNRNRAQVPLWVKLLYPLGKGWRSLQRHRYLRAHHDEFYPAEKPRQRPGRSARLR